MSESRERLEVKSDFAALRAERNAAVVREMNALAAEYGLDPSAVHSSFDPSSCYCDCPSGPCEHDFQGWRDFDDGRGGEQVCARCGTGAMSHSMRVGP